MASTLILGTAQKAAAAQLRVPCDFGNEPLFKAGYTASSYGVSTPAGSGNPTISGVQLDYPYQVSGLISGGTAGNAYNITYTVTMNDPDGTVYTGVGVLQVL
jgi:hypothetical protein